MLARTRVTFSPLAALAALNAVLLVYANWLALWEVRGLSDWSLTTVTLLFLFTLSIFFVCALALPRTAHVEAPDMEAHYWRERRTFYLAWLVSCLIAIACNLSLAAGMSRSNLISESLSNLVGAAAAAFAILLPGAMGAVGCGARPDSQRSRLSARVRQRSGVSAGP